MEKQNLNYTEFDLKMDVREAYVNLVAAKEILIVLEQRRRLLNDLLAIAKNVLRQVKLKKSMSFKPKLP